METLPINPALEIAVVDWVNWMLSANRSITTTTAYRWEVRALGKRYPELAPRDFRLADLTRYQAERRLANVGDSASKRAASAFRSFFSFACGKKSPAKSLPVPTVKALKRKPRTLTLEQADAVMGVCESTRARGVRDLALIALMLESALRNAEVCRLELAKVDLEHHRLSVIVKGGKEEAGSFDALTAQYLAAWINLRRDIAQPATKTLFCSVGGLTPGAPLTTAGMQAIFKVLGKAAGLTDGFSPHDLRRSCATLKTQLGAPTRTIQVGGRWSALREVETYTRNVSLADFERYSIVQHLYGQPTVGTSNVKPGV